VTDASALIMAECARGAQWSEILATVSRRWPEAPEQLIRSMVLELVRYGFLITDLLPENGGDDPLGHFLRRIPAAHSLRENLTVVREHLAEADCLQPGAPERLRALAAAQVAADRVLAHEQPPFCADVIIDADVVLPARLAEEAADAAGVLWRIGNPADPLAAYHDRFVARYGQNRFVRLLDAADPVTGIGADVAAAEQPMPAGVVAILASLLTGAAARQETEVALDAATVDALAAACGSGGADPPRTAEIYARVIADSPEAAAAGRLRLAVCPGGHTQTAGSSSGRFALLIPGLQLATDRGSGVAVAELAVRARTPVGAMLAAPTGFGDYRIPLGVPARPGDLEPADLLLLSDGHRLFLWSQRLGQAIVPVLYSRLSPRLLPPVAHLLRLIGNSRRRPWRTWSWGPLAGTPFQPRVGYRTTILAPARWVLPPSVARAATGHADWDAVVEQWRQAVVPSAPDVVVVEDHDRALPIDLRRPEDRALLRRYVRRGAQAVTEQPGGANATRGVMTGPAGRHALELVLSLASPRVAGLPLPASPVPGATPGHVRRTGDGLHLPGGDWLSLAIPTPASCQDEVIARVGAVARDFPSRWFWLRYSDSAGARLRVRFHAAPSMLSTLILPAMASLAEQLVEARLASGLLVEPYEEETERYGGNPLTMAAAERVFAADSRLALAVLADTPDTDERTVIAALSAASIARIPGAGRAALPARQLDRNGHRRLTDLRPRTRAAASTSHAGLAMSPAHPAWSARAAALADYWATVPEQRRPSCASSMIHMHVNRVLGRVDLEPLVRALAADLLFWPSASAESCAASQSQ
jgi:thiopeptide-type bacteriocin biosynthesis protein